MQVHVKLVFHDGYRMNAIHPSWGAACRWVEDFKHHIQCNHAQCVRGYHNGRETARPVTVIMTTLSESEVMYGQSRARSVVQEDDASSSEQGSHCIRLVTEGEELISAADTGFAAVLHGSNNERETTADATQHGQDAIYERD